VSFPTVRRIRSVAIGSVIGLVLGATVVAAVPANASTPAQDEEVTLRLGYFPNVTHAPAIVGVEAGLYEDALGDGVNLELLTFSTGTTAIEALSADAIDATYIGPNPAINGFAQSDGEALRIVSGSTSGGAFLVVKPEITKPKDLKGTTLATPSLGNTQDVALRSYLKTKGLETDTEGGGDVSIVPQDNALTLEAFQAGDIDGAWVPEPWATRLIDEGGGKVLVDEADLWPDGQYVTTHLIVAKPFLDENRAVVQKLIEGHVAAINFLAEDPDVAQNLVADGIESVTGKAVAAELIRKTFANLTFTNDPIASSLAKSAEDAEELGLLDPVDLKGIYDLKLLNKVLKKAGQPTVSAK
jgi:NitT/TauT family transport system substrate-binding protein